MIVSFSKDSLADPMLSQVYIEKSLKELRDQIEELKGKGTRD